MHRLAFVALIFAALTISPPAFAHHSFAMFDKDKTVTITGTIKEFQWTNPHVWTQIMVKNADGVEEEWGIEHQAPGTIGRKGWNRNTLKPGDHVIMVINPMRTGEKGGAFVSVTKDDGTVWTNSGPQTAATPQPSAK